MDTRPARHMDTIMMDTSDRREEAADHLGRFETFPYRVVYLPGRNIARPETIREAVALVLTPKKMFLLKKARVRSCFSLPQYHAFLNALDRSMMAGDRILITNETDAKAAMSFLSTRGYREIKDWASEPDQTRINAALAQMRNQDDHWVWVGDTMFYAPTYLTILEKEPENEGAQTVTGNPNSIFYRFLKWARVTTWEPRGPLGSVIRWANTLTEEEVQAYGFWTGVGEVGVILGAIFLAVPAAMGEWVARHLGSLPAGLDPSAHPALLAVSVLGVSLAIFVAKHLLFLWRQIAQRNPDKPLSWGEAAFIFLQQMLAFSPYLALQAVVIIFPHATITIIVLGFFAGGVHALYEKEEIARDLLMEAPLPPRSERLGFRPTPANLALGATPVLRSAAGRKELDTLLAILPYDYFKTQASATISSTEYLRHLDPRQVISNIDFLTEVARRNPRLGHVSIEGVVKSIIAGTISPALRPHDRRRILGTIDRDGAFYATDDLADVNKFKDEISEQIIKSNKMGGEKFLFMFGVDLFDFAAAPPAGWEERLLRYTNMLAQYRPSLNEQGLGRLSLPYASSLQVSHHTHFEPVMLGIIRRWRYLPSPDYEELLAFHLDQEGLHPRTPDSPVDLPDLDVDAQLLDMAFKRLEPGRNQGRPPLTISQTERLQLGVVWCLSRHEPQNVEKLLTPAEQIQVGKWARDILAHCDAQQISLKNWHLDSLGSDWPNFSVARSWDKPVDEVVTALFEPENTARLSEFFQEAIPKTIVRPGVSQWYLEDLAKMGAAAPDGNPNSLFYRFLRWARATTWRPRGPLGRVIQWAQELPTEKVQLYGFWTGVVEMAAILGAIFLAVPATAGEWVARHLGPLPAGLNPSVHPIALAVSVLGVGLAAFVLGHVVFLWRQRTPGRYPLALGEALGIFARELAAFESLPWTSGGAVGLSESLRTCRCRTRYRRNRWATFLRAL